MNNNIKGMVSEVFPPPQRKLTSFPHAFSRPLGPLLHLVPSIMTKDYQYLTREHILTLPDDGAQTYNFGLAEQVDQFMEHGYIVVKNAFTPEQAADFTKDLWVRLDMDPNDKTTWTKERIHMPRMRVVSTKEFAPKVSS